MQVGDGVICEDRDLRVAESPGRIRRPLVYSIVCTAKNSRRPRSPARRSENIPIASRRNGQLSAAGRLASVPRVSCMRGDANNRRRVIDRSSGYRTASSWSERPTSRDRRVYSAASTA